MACQRTAERMLQGSHDGSSGRYESYWERWRKGGRLVGKEREGGKLGERRGRGTEGGEGWGRRPEGASARRRPRSARDSLLSAADRGVFSLFFFLFSYFFLFLSIFSLFFLVGVGV